MTTDIYSDGIGGITVTAGMVRIDLVSITGQNEDGNATYERTGRLVMPVQGFLRTFSIAEEMMGRLMKAGLVQKTPPTESEPAVAVDPAEVTSPNFRPRPKAP